MYTRDAMALQALRVRVGDQDLFTAPRPWATERRNGNASVDEYLTQLRQISGENIDDVAQTWLFTPARPPAPLG